MIVTVLLLASFDGHATSERFERAVHSVAHDNGNVGVAGEWNGRQCWCCWRRVTPTGGNGVHCIMVGNFIIHVHTPSHTHALQEKEMSSNEQKETKNERKQTRRSNTHWININSHESSGLFNKDTYTRYQNCLTTRKASGQCHGTANIANLTQWQWYGVHTWKLSAVSRRSYNSKHQTTR